MAETEAETMTREKEQITLEEPITLDTLERLDEMREGLDALELMIAAYFMGPDEFDERRTANAMQAIIDQLQDKLTVTKYEAKAALQGLKMA